MRIVVAHALQVISNIMASDDVWAFALSSNDSQHRGITFFDIRIRVGVNGVLYNLHLITMPHFDHHTFTNQEAMLVQLLGTLFAWWTRKLIDVTTDGEKTNMGHSNDVQVRMVRRAKFKVVQIWCTPHQLDLVVHVAVDEVDNGPWVKTYYTLSTYLRKQSNLITNMGETCPKKTNWWVTLESVLKFSSATHHRVPRRAFRVGRQRRTAHPDVVLVDVDVRVRPSHRHNQRDDREAAGASFGDLPVA